MDERKMYMTALLVVRGWRQIVSEAGCFWFGPLHPGGAGLELDQAFKIQVEADGDSER